jgi:aryl-alcohol dehydrogenase-like predicted oxidoreductase
VIIGVWRKAVAHVRASAIGSSGGLARRERLSGPGIFGPPSDPKTALAVLQAVSSGVNHVDTSDYYGRTSPTN